MTKHREFGPDNLRGILILLVVFAHLLENGTPFRGAIFLYRTIYSFHMPAFLFLTGYFARFDTKKIIWGLVVPYGIFQTLYLCFDGWLGGTDVVLQYTTPYWILWYLMVCIFYHILLPLYTVDSWKRQLLVLGITFALSLLAGYDRAVGYRLSLSRFFVFQPWFLLGYYSRRGDWIRKLTRWSGERDFLLKLLLTVAVCILPLVMQVLGFSYKILYGASSYELLNYGPLERSFAAITGLAWIGFGVVVLMPLLQRRIPVLTSLGQNTMSVFLLHGFAVRYIQLRQPQLLNTPLMVGLVTVLLLAACGNNVVGTAFRKLFSGNRMQKMKEQGNDTG